MATFIVQVKDKTGNVLEERVVANSQDEARRILRKRYAAVGKIRKAGMDFDLASIEAALSKVSVKDKAIFPVNLPYWLMRGLQLFALCQYWQSNQEILSLRRL